MDSKVSNNTATRRKAEAVRRDLKEATAYLKRYEKCGIQLTGEAMYCLPEKLLVAFEGEYTQVYLMHVKEQKLELSFAKWCAKRGYAGLFHGLPVCPGNLAIPEFIDQNTVKPWEMKRAQTKQLCQNRLRGYAGWLVVNKQFRAELHRPKARAKKSAFDGVFPLINWFAPKDSSGRGKGRFELRYREFCQRWCLARLITWDLPDPQGPLLPSLSGGIPPALASMGMSLFLPATFKPPTGLVNSETLHECRTVALNEAGRWKHLKEWLGIVNGTQSGRNKTKFSDLLTVFVCWQALMSRYAGRVDNCSKSDLYFAFGQFLRELRGMEPFGGSEKARQLIRRVRQSLATDAS